MKIRLYKLPWRVWGFTKLKDKIIFDLGYFSIWIMWRKNEEV